MTPFGDSSHQEDDRNFPALPPYLAPRAIPNRPISGTAPAIYRHRAIADRAPAHSTRTHDEELDDAALVFDAIYDAFQAQRVMLCALAELRGEDGAESFW